MTPTSGPSEPSHSRRSMESLSQEDDQSHTRGPRSPIERLRWRLGSAIEQRIKALALLREEYAPIAPWGEGARRLRRLERLIARDRAQLEDLNRP